VLDAVNVFGLDNISERIIALVSSFEEKTDVPIGLDIVQISMLTHRFGHYFDCGHS
jgi:hypothetical protein